MALRTPAGCDLDSFWATLLSGTSAIRPIERFDVRDLPVRFGGEVRGFDPLGHLGAREVRQLDRATQLGTAAADEAVTDAGLLPATDPGRRAVVVGTGLGGIESFHLQDRAYLEGGPGRLSPRAIPMLMPNATAAVIAIRLGWTGPNLCLTTACAAGAHAVGEGVRMIRDGSADVVLAGGTEAALTPVGLAAFARMGALSLRNDRPDTASRPFDAARDGFVLSEGAAFVVLESGNSARLRGAHVHGAILGYGRNCDAHHVTAPAPGGTRAAECIHLALVDAGITPDAVSHVNAHGTSTGLNDVAEAGALHRVFGDRPPPVTSVKGTTGHLIGASGAVEVVASLLAARNGVVPPTANHEVTDDEVGLDVVAGSPRHVGPGPVLSTSFSFGGHNAALVVARVPGAAA